MDGDDREGINIIGIGIKIRIWIDIYDACKFGIGPAIQKEMRPGQAQGQTGPAKGARAKWSGQFGKRARAIDKHSKYIAPVGPSHNTVFIWVRHTLILFRTSLSGHALPTCDLLILF